MAWGRGAPRLRVGGGAGRRRGKGRGAWPRGGRTRCQGARAQGAVDVKSLGGRAEAPGGKWLEASGAVLEASGSVLGPFSAVLGPSRPLCCRLDAAMEPYWRRLGAERAPEHGNQGGGSFNDARGAGGVAPRNSPQGPKDNREHSNTPLVPKARWRIEKSPINRTAAG